MEDSAQPNVVQTPTDAIRKKFSWKNVLLGIIIGAILVGIVAITFWYFTRPKESETSPPNTTKTSTSSASPVTKDETMKLSFLAWKDSSSHEKGEALFIADKDGNNKEILQEFIYKDPKVSYLSWDFSPDNKKIVASSGVIIDIASKKQTPIPSGRCHNWSPDGKKIIYESSGISIMDSDGTNPKKLITDGGLCAGSNNVYHWSPNSTKFFYGAQESIYSFNLLTNEKSLVFDSKSQNIYVRQISVARDGSKIVFLGYGKAKKVEDDVEDVYTVNADGKGLQKLTNFNKYGVASQPIFTPDGKNIVFSVSNIYNSYSGLNLVNIGTKEIKNLSKDNADSYSPASISKDGEFISYTSGASTYGTVVTVNVTNGSITKLGDSSLSGVHWSK